MRSVLAGLRRLVIPWGAPPSQPHIAIGQDVPPELATFYAPDVFIGSIIMQREPGVFFYTGMTYTTNNTSAYVFGVAVNGVVTELDRSEDWTMFVGVITRLIAADEIAIDADAVLQLLAVQMNLTASFIFTVASPTIDLNGTVREQSRRVVGIGGGTWTPALTSTGTNPTLGGSGSSATGTYRTADGLCFARGNIEFGSSPSAGTGNYRLSLPVALESGNPSGGTIGGGTVIGTGILRDDSSLAANGRTVVLHSTSATTALMAILDGSNTQMSAGTPFTIAAGDMIAFNMVYPIAT